MYADAMFVRFVYFCSNFHVMPFLYVAFIAPNCPGFGHVAELCVVSVCGSYLLPVDFTNFEIYKHYFAYRTSVNQYLYLTRC